MIFDDVGMLAEEVVAAEVDEAVAAQGERDETRQGRHEPAVDRLDTVVGQIESLERLEILNNSVARFSQTNSFCESCIFYRIMYN